MNRFSPILLSCALLASLTASGCAGARSSVPFLSSSGRPLSLFALSPAAKDGILSGSSSAAWFRLNPSKALPGPIPRSIQVSLVSDSASPASVSLGLVTAEDLDSSGRLVSDPAPRSLSTLNGFSGAFSISMIVPADSSQSPVRGFAVSMESSGSARIRIVSAEIASPSVGWRTSRSSRWAGFPSSGGMLDVSAFASGAVSAVPVALPPDSVLSLSFDPAISGSVAGVSGAEPPSPVAPADGIDGAISRQGRSRFSANGRIFSFRNVPVPFSTSVPSALFGNAPVTVRLAEPGAPVSGIAARVGARFPAAEPENPLSPILADPHVMIEWPRTAWRRGDRELFAWDRFPSILVFDTADYAVQDRYFRRLAFFVEKEGYRGKLLRDDELEGLHAFNAHDYRAESLAAFFEEARKLDFPLNAEENELRDILLAEGIIARSSKKFIPGAGAVLSFSRESVSYLRYMFVAHEGFHGIYFIDPDFRAKVSAVYRSMDPRAMAFLESYFSLYDSLGYDTGDAYLMENEFMAYLLQQPLAKVGPYFTGIIHERFLRNGGDPALAAYIAESGAAEFVRAAGELNDYVFTRWGIAGGRVGLFSISD